MASASTRIPNSAILPRTSSRSQRRQIVLVIACLLLCVGVVSGRNYLGPWVGLALATLTTLLACSFWHFHLQAGGMSAAWSLLFVSLQAGQFLIWSWDHRGAYIDEWQGALGCAAFTYAMLWVFKVHDNDSGLRALATAALLLSIGIIAKPPLLICCALLSVAVFFDEERQVGEFFNSLLLLLTPVVLCMLAIATLRALAVQGVAQFAWSASQNQLDPAPLHLLSLARQLPGLSFCAAVLMARVLMRKAGSPDLAFLFLVIILPTLGMAPWMPQPVSTLDVAMIISWGAACLLALDPPTSMPTRLVALAGVSFSLYFSR